MSATTRHVPACRTGLAIGLLLLSACSAPERAKAPPPLDVLTTHVRRETVATYETLDGQVDPYLQANVATEQGGTILKIYANEGDRVSEGQPLAKIDDAPLRAALVEQQGANGAAAAKLSEAQTQLPITTTLYASALTQASQAVTQAIDQQIADRANLATAKSTYDADAQLVREGYVAQTTFEQVRATYVAAEQTLAADGARVTEARAALAEARRNCSGTSSKRTAVPCNRRRARFS